MSEIKLFKYIPDDENFFNKCCNILDGFDEKVSEYNQEKITYTLRFKKNMQKILFLISYGKKRPQRCYDRDHGEYDDTVLSDDIIHMTNEFIFVIYADRVLCSDHAKRNVIINFLNSKDSEFSCKLSSQAATIEEFIERVNTIDEISISATENLFTKEMIRPLWYEDFEEKEEPKETNVKMQFDRALKESYLRKMYAKLKETPCISSFSIKGSGIDGFISINEESIISREIYNFEKHDGYYSLDEIFEKI